MGQQKFRRPLLVEGNTVTGDYTLPAATTTTIGGVKMTAAIADSTEVTAPTTAEFNALLAALRTAGIITPSE